MSRMIPRTTWTCNAESLILESSANSFNVMCFRRQVSSDCKDLEDNVGIRPYHHLFSDNRIASGIRIFRHLSDFTLTMKAKRGPWHQISLPRAGLRAVGAGFPFSRGIVFFLRRLAPTPRPDTEKRLGGHISGSMNNQPRIQLMMPFTNVIEALVITRPGNRTTA